MQPVTRSPCGVGGGPRGTRLELHTPHAAQSAWHAHHGVGPTAAPPLHRQGGSHFMKRAPTLLPVPSVCLTLALQRYEQLVAELPPAPDACSLELRQKIAWGVATSAYQVCGAAPKP